MEEVMRMPNIKYGLRGWIVLIMFALYVFATSYVAGKYLLFSL